MSEAVSEQLAAFLCKHSLFSILDTEQIERLASQLEVERYSLGETIVREGEVGEHAWLIFAGRVRILKKSDSGRQVTLGTQSVGEIFGEQAILSDTPRSATVRATEDVVLCRIERQDFRDLVDASPRIRSYFDRFMQERSIRDFLRTATFLENLRPQDVMALFDQLEFVEFSGGDSICAQDDSGDALFIIRSGQCRVVQHSGKEEHTLRTLTEGEYFGERALLTDEPRSATVVAEDFVRCFRLDRKHFEELIKTAPRLRDQLVERFTRYQESDSAGNVQTDPTEKQDAFDANATSSSHLPDDKLASDEPAAIDDPPASKDFLPALNERELRADERQQRLHKPLFNNRTWVPQLFQTDCGPACLAMVARCFGIRIAGSNLRSLAQTGRIGTSLSRLAEAARAIGFRTHAVHTDQNRLSEFQFPAIAVFRDHYVVIHGISENWITVGDPARGPRLMAHHAFYESWTGDLLLLEPTSMLEANEPPVSPLRRLIPHLKFIGPTIAALCFTYVATPLSILFVLVALRWLRSDEMLGFVGENAVAPISHSIVLHGATGITGLWVLGYAVRRQFGSRVESVWCRALTDAVDEAMQKTRKWNRQWYWEFVQYRSDVTSAIDLFLYGAPGLISNAVVALTSMACIAAIHVDLIVPMIVAALAEFSLLAGLWATSQEDAIHKSTQTRAVESVDPAPIESLTEIEAQLMTDLAMSKAVAAFGLSEQRRRASRAIPIALDESKKQIISVSVCGSGVVGLLWVAFGKLEDQVVSAPDVAALSIFSLTMMLSFVRFADQIVQIRAALISLTRLSELLAPAQIPPRDSRRVDVDAIRGRVRFEDVEFRYDRSHVLTGLSFCVEPGQSVAVVGRSGNSRSTLLRLIQGEESPTAGRVLIDEVERKSLDTETLLSIACTARQRPLIVCGSFRDNVCMFKPDITDDQVFEVLRIAELDQFVDALPSGIRTRLIPDAFPLPAGIRQQIGIARIVLSDTPIVLFDEAMSAIDAATRRRIDANLRPFLRDRTVFFVPSRLNEACHADRIVVLDQGTIVEIGTHAELMERAGLYNWLFTQEQQR